MAIRLYRENGAKCHLEWQQKTASENFTFNDIVGITTAGRLTRYLDGSLFPEYGLVQKTIASTDSDYASTTRIPVLVCGDEAEYLCDVSTGTAALTDVGEYIDVDDQNSVDVGASTNNDFYVTGFVSTTQVIAKMARKHGRVVE